MLAMAGAGQQSHLLAWVACTRYREHHPEGAGHGPLAAAVQQMGRIFSHVV